ncbi:MULTISPECIES: hypothetical protein [Aliiglaciecola]|uniref:hypothetical protein n=1 Tax=Aliiglaciecola TaxID=1406885 RepID=UPI001C09D16B|nr:MULTISPECIES: hypothetical protein [Aliiglaciecola]MBU2878988.1 hypothetical protein [Aliiglaciecola lipolytica]MDO6710689.1 hypothetical protein [Aliiglaciecola sp. 2_MG-2023]MDO6751903.1 hypothetical protein [Aliiglaciecola sp. 1_MG-2023]
MAKNLFVDLAIFGDSYLLNRHFPLSIQQKIVPGRMHINLRSNQQNKEMKQ